MTILYVLIPVALGMGLVALTSFMWSLRASQYEDLPGAAERILLDIDGAPLPGAAPVVPPGRRRDGAATDARGGARAQGRRADDADRPRTGDAQGE